MLEIWSSFRKSKKASSPVISKFLPEPYVIFHEKTLHICCLLFYWILSNCVTLVRCFSCFLDHKHVHVEHPWNKIKSDYGCPKKIKDGMPKKHDPKKREREKKGVAMSQKKEKERDIGMIRERKAITSRSKSYPSIHSYTCTFWSRLHDLFLLGFSLWLYNK